MEYWARTTENDRKQPLQDHLKGVAQRTKQALPEELQSLGYYAGLWHDLGKYRPEWQDYLLKKGKKCTHAAHGAMLALDQMRTIVPAIAYAIAGHHTGLPKSSDFKKRDFKRKYGKDWEKALKNAQSEIENFLPETFPDIDLPTLRREFAIRMLFSALVDSDRLDAAYFEGLRLNPRPQTNFNPRQLEPATSEINQLRNVFASDCIAAATHPKGFFRLTGVCGIGKTKSSLRWGCIHAETHQMRGIVYVAPVKVIIEQTAQVYRDLLGLDNVLEHHSGYEPKTEDTRNYKLDTERWDKPYIVTSGVQFYESLFSHRPGQCRKLHQLRDRVILIDEAQTIPLHLVIPILDVLETLVQDWGCSIVLMSATQPDFSRLSFSDSQPFLQLWRDARDIIPRDRVLTQYQQLQRVTYHLTHETPWTWDNLLDDIQASGHQQNLIVVNTTKLAREGYQALQNRFGNNTFHLSSRMCPQHRFQVLNEIKDCLKNSSPCYLISTQVIEAGVDIDFPRVYRQLAPLDSIIQTAGRCNRNQRQSPENAVVTVFDLPKSSSPSGDYSKRINITKAVLNNHDYPLGADILPAIQEYFQRLYTEMNAGGQKIQSLRQKYDFPAVDEHFCIIDNDYTTAVVVPWQDGIKRINKLSSKDFLTQAEWRSIQAYSATVPKEHPQIKNCTNGLQIWTGDYDENLGCLE
jgi:CRISPR-associated endonuclease/helicase Cas3